MPDDCFTENELVEIDEFLAQISPHAKNISGELQRARQLIACLRSYFGGAGSWQALCDALGEYDQYLSRSGDFRRS